MSEPTGEPLKNCPMCGGPGALNVERYPSGQERWWGYCDGDTTCNLVLDAQWPTQEQAIAAWNRRAWPSEEALARCIAGIPRHTLDYISPEGTAMKMLRDDEGEWCRFEDLAHAVWALLNGGTP